jgi:hypothetical protein
MSRCALMLLQQQAVLQLPLPPTSLNAESRLGGMDVGSDTHAAATHALLLSRTRFLTIRASKNGRLRASKPQPMKPPVPKLHGAAPPLLAHAAAAALMLLLFAVDYSVVAGARSTTVAACSWLAAAASAVLRQLPAAVCP